MKLTYHYNKDIIEISETINELDVEFDIKIYAEKNWVGFKELQRTFEKNRVCTDVLFYPFKNQHFKVIVRKDSYSDFILGLMKHQLLESINWN